MRSIPTITALFALSSYSSPLGFDKRLSDTWTILVRSTRVRMRVMRRLYWPDRQSPRPVLGEVSTVQERLEQMTEELRKLEQARDLLREVEGRLRQGDGSEVEDHL